MAFLVVYYSVIFDYISFSGVLVCMGDGGEIVELVDGLDGEKIGI